MKTTLKKLSKMVLLISGILAIGKTTKAQDCIVTVTGKTIHGHVKKIKNDEITYRKFFHKFKISPNKVLYIVDENGTKTVINNITMAKHYKNYSQLASSAPAVKTDTLGKKTGNQAQAPAHYIERIGNHFRIDTTRIIGTGALNDLVSQSTNPIVALNLKAAKTMRTFCAISKIASFPGSASGAFASYTTFKNLFTQLKSGPAPLKTYIGAGLSFMATLTLPITSGILKHIQNKLYDKTLITYSMGN